MNLIDLKERIAISDSFTPEERDFVLAAINEKAAAGLIEVHSPLNYMGRIDAIWIVLSVDDGGEGIVAAPFPNMTTMPLICSDKRKLDVIVPMARAIASALGKTLRLVKFTQRENVEVYQP